MVYSSARTAMSRRRLNDQQEYKLRSVVSSLKAQASILSALANGKGPYFAHRCAFLQKVRTFPRVTRRGILVQEKLRGLDTTARRQGFLTSDNARAVTPARSKAPKRPVSASKLANRLFILARLRTVLRASKLSMQQHLLTANLTASAQNRLKISMNTASMQKLRLYPLRTSVISLAPTKTQSVKLASHTTKLPLRASLNRGAKRTHDIGGATFLTQKPAHFAQPQAAATHFTADLVKRRLQHHEAHFYHKRPQLRLPYTDVTRYRRRKAGLVTFTRNSLKQPRTLRGQQNLLLPPIATYGASKGGYRAGAISDIRKCFALAARRGDEWPVFWRRPHNRANINAVASVRR